MSLTDIVGYTYCAEILCPGCTASAVGWDGQGGERGANAYIEKTGLSRGIDVRDEYTFDSSEWPKVVFGSDVGSYEVCGACHGPLT